MTTRKHPLEAKMTVKTVEETKNNSVPLIDPQSGLALWCCPLAAITMLTSRPIAHTTDCEVTKANKK